MTTPGLNLRGVIAAVQRSVRGASIRQDDATISRLCTAIRYLLLDKVRRCAEFPGGEQADWYVRSTGLHRLTTR
jgi:hypothetical protein